MAINKDTVKIKNRLIDLCLALGLQAAADVAEAMAQGFANDPESEPVALRTLETMARLYRVESERLSKDEAPRESPSAH